MTIELDWQRNSTGQTLLATTTAAREMAAMMDSVCGGLRERRALLLEAPPPADPAQDWAGRLQAHCLAAVLDAVTETALLSETRQEQRLAETLTEQGATVQPDVQGLRVNGVPVRVPHLARIHSRELAELAVALVAELGRDEARRSVKDTRTK